MLKLDIKHQIVLYFKQLEYQYTAFLNNRAVERAFVYDFQSPPPPARVISLTKNHYLLAALFFMGLISTSLMITSKPVRFSKQALLNFKIEKKLIKIPPAVLKTNTIEKVKVEDIKLSPVKIKPISADPVISRENFMNRTTQYTLLVNKQKKKLFVTEENQDGYSVVKEFQVSVGIASGDKHREGDNKTPEGIYSLIDFKTDDELPKKYGPYAAVLNYPNREDLKKGKTGSGIWIHGTGTDQRTPDTQGCVELSDKHLLQLYSYISKGTKIIIMPENTDISPKKNIVSKDVVFKAISS